MTAKVIQLPVVRIERHADRQCLSVELDPDIQEKLECAAFGAALSPEDLAEALIVYGLAAVEKKNPDDFLKELNSRPRPSVPA